MTDPAIELEATCLVEAARAFLRAADELLIAASLVRQNRHGDRGTRLSEAQFHIERATTNLVYAEEASRK